MTFTDEEKQLVIRAVRNRLGQHEDDLRRTEHSNQGEETYADDQRYFIALHRVILDKIENPPTCQCCERTDNLKQLTTLDSTWYECPTHLAMSNKE